MSSRTLSSRMGAPQAAGRSNDLPAPRRREIPPAGSRLHPTAASEPGSAFHVNQGNHGFILFAVFLLVVQGALSCGESEKKRPTAWPDGLFLPDATTVLDSNLNDLGQAPDGLPNDVGGPKIELLSPDTTKPVVVSTMTVQAKVTDTEWVNTQSVTVTIQGKTPTTMVHTATPDVFEAKLDISSLNGQIRFWITAADMLGKKSTKIFVVTHDAGPSIVFISPSNGLSYREKATVQVQVVDTVDIESFSVKVGSEKVQLNAWNTDKRKQKYTGDLTFAKFLPPLSGKQVLTAEAVNINKAKSTASLTFYADDKGPIITIKSHKAGETIGGIIKLQADVTDTAGVVSSTVMCIIGNDADARTVKLTNSSTAPETYEGQFDTRTLKQTYLWPVMSFRATDSLGNESHLDIQVGLDNMPPILELDPPEDFFVAQFKNGYYECSRPFDPIGSDAVDDLQQAPQITTIRGRFQDKGNYIPSAKWVPIVGIDATTTFLYVLRDTTQALVYDSDGDGICDDINPEIIPTGSKPKANQAVAVKMEAIPAQGKADFRAPVGAVPAKDGSASDADSGSSSTGEKLHSVCSSWGSETKAPDPLCLTTPATVWIYYSTNKEPNIYTIPPIVSGSKSVTCGGLPFDFLANQVTDGWVCVAATAKDKLGNRGVSTPLRLYVNNSTSFTKPSDTLPATAGPPPNCTGTLDKVTGKVVTTTTCSFNNPRKGSDPKLKIYKCDTTMTHPQMYCHREALLE